MNVLQDQGGVEEECGVDGGGARVGAAGAGAGATPCGVGGLDSGLGMAADGGGDMLR